MPNQTDLLHPTAAPTKRAIAVGVVLPDSNEDEARASLSELVKLLEGLGILVVAEVFQKRPTPGVLGSGKIEEMRELLGHRPALEDDESEPEPSELHADLVAIDTEVRPGDAHSLEKRLGVEVMDRTGVILEVFQQRAHTQAAKLEIEIARLLYNAPRQRDDDSLEGRVGGGGRGGRGHTNAELAKQALRERVAKLRRDLEAVQRANASRRARRAMLPTAALIGYTNAGKSSWMRALTGSEVLVEDKLFATLGTTVRVMQPKTSPRTLVSDTVGFVRNLPHGLVASFKATLDEARDADLLLIVADASDPQMYAHLEVTREVLGEIEADQLPSVLVLNKLDLVDAERRAELAAEFPEALLVSSRRSEDVTRLRQAVLEFFDGQMIDLDLVVPYSALGLLPQIHEQARVVEERYGEGGAELAVRALPVVAGQLRSLVGGVAP